MNFAKGAGSRWPDQIEASDIHLTPLQPGLVYGTYRYRVRYGAEEHSGISERMFVKTPDGWKIGLTGAIDAPAGTPPAPRAITGATLIDGRGGAPVTNANVIIRDGKIDCAGALQRSRRCRHRRCDHGMWLMPGLIDAHVHFSQTGWGDGRPDALDVRATHPYDAVEADLKANPERYGHRMSAPASPRVRCRRLSVDAAARERFANDTSAPHVVAAGPLLSTLDHWLNLPAERQFIHLHDERVANSASRI